QDRVHTSFCAIVQIRLNLRRGQNHVEVPRRITNQEEWIFALVLQVAPVRTKCQRKACFQSQGEMGSDGLSRRDSVSATTSKLEYAVERFYNRNNCVWASSGEQMNS